MIDETNDERNDVGSRLHSMTEKTIEKREDRETSSSCRVGHSVGDTMGKMEDSINNVKMKIRARSLWERGLS